MALADDLRESFARQEGGTSGHPLQLVQDRVDFYDTVPDLYKWINDQMREAVQE